MFSPRFLAATVVGTLAASAAYAHPHVFVTAGAGFLTAPSGDLAAVQVTWTYDAFTSLTFFEILDLDQDGDGVLDAADLARLVEAQTIWPDDFVGDTYLEHGASPVALGRPEAGRSWMSDGRISVSFELPLETPLEPTSDVVLRLYDPTYYIAYSTTSLDVTPDGCEAEIIPFQSASASDALQAQLSQLSRDETPQSNDVGRVFADRVRLTCG